MPVNLDELRDELLDYCGMAAFEGYDAAMAQIVEIELAVDDELPVIAEVLGHDAWLPAKSDEGGQWPW